MEFTTIVIDIVLVIVLVGTSVFVAWKINGRNTVVAAAKELAAEMVGAAYRWAYTSVTADTDKNSIPDGRQRMEWLLTSAYDSLPEDSRKSIEAIAARWNVTPRAALQTLAQDAYDKGVAVLQDWMSRNVQPQPDR